MDLLTLARGPLLVFALIIFFGGIVWRVTGLMRMKTRPPLSTPRRSNYARAGLRTLLRRMLPRKGVRPSATLININPYAYHIGLALIVFGFAPHIAFLERLTGISWPALPDMVMYFAAAVTITSLLMALLFRLTDPVLRLISRLDDFAAWAIVMLPIATGMALMPGYSAGSQSAQGFAPDTMPLAIHLLSVELLLIWFPFGKLMHAFLFAPGRWNLGAFLERRGVRA